MTTWLLVALGGAAGAVSRYAVAVALGARNLPWATFAVNISGALVLGVVLSLSLRGPWSPAATRAVAVGFLGAYTTFSTFAWEIFALGRDDRLLEAGLYAAASVAFGILAAGLGYRLAEALQR